jgi:hypothetical protein
MLKTGLKNYDMHGKLSKIFKLLGSCGLIYLLALTSCESDVVKLDRGDRLFIDTTASKEMNRLAPELDKWCTDSSPVLIKKLTDSLVLVREQEILQKSYQGQ